MNQYRLYRTTYLHNEIQQKDNLPVTQERPYDCFYTAKIVLASHIVSTYNQEYDCRIHINIDDQRVVLFKNSTVYNIDAASLDDTITMPILGFRDPNNEYKVVFSIEEDQE